MNNITVTIWIGFQWGKRNIRMAFMYLLTYKGAGSRLLKTIFFIKDITHLLMTTKIWTFSMQK